MRQRRQIPRTAGVRIATEIVDQCGDPVVREQPPWLQEHVEVRRPQPFPELELWTVTASARLWTARNTRFAFCRVSRMLEPQQWTYRRRAYSMTPRSMMTIEPGEVHVTTEVGPSDFHLLQVEPSLLVQEWAEQRPYHSLHFREGQLNSDAALHELALLCEAIETQGCDALELAHRLRRFVEVTWQHASEGPPRLQASGCERAVRRAREYIEENYMRAISLDEVAKLVDLSKFHIDRSFCEKIGVPPHEYLRKVRIARAMEQLRQGMRPAQVAQLVGFVDQPHMHRTFKAQLGFTPGYYAACVGGRRGKIASH